MSLMVLVLSDPVRFRDHEVALAEKTFSGIKEFSRRWPGEMVVIADETDAGIPGPNVTVPRAGEGYELVARGVRAATRALASADVVHAMHLVGNAKLLDEVDPRRIVWSGEFPIGERIRIGSLGASVPDRLRVAAGWARREPRLRRMIRAAGGFQSNGYPALEAYGGLARSSLLYFDTRVRDVVDPEVLRERRAGASGRPLSLAFSGRHTLAKGAVQALQAFAALRSSGTEARMHVLGEGELTGSMRVIAEPWSRDVVFHGSIRYETEWVELISTEVDMMVLPHLQGDPAGTYLEAAALGVPVVGFANAALCELVDRHHIGWVAPRGDVDELAVLIQKVSAEPDELARAGDAGIELMRAHTFEQEFGRRTEHLARVARG